MSATPGQLKAKVAELFRLPANAVDYPWRVLREAGLVSKGGRGPSAAKVTPRDAALLLIAVAGPLPASDVVSAVRRYADLPLQVWPGVKPNDSLPLPEAITDATTFADALAGLIACAADGSLHQARADALAAQPGPHPVNIFHMEASLFGAYPQASFRVFGRNVSCERMFSALPTDMEVLRDWKSDQEGDDSDLRTVNRFGEKTIWGLGELIGDAPRDAPRSTSFSPALTALMAPDRRDQK